LKNLASQLATDMAQNPTTAKTVGVITAGTGLATVFEWLTFGVGAAASLMGLALTILLFKKNLIEYKILKRDLAERKLRNGVRTRRAD